MKGKQGEYHDALFNKNNTVSRSCAVFTPTRNGAQPVVLPAAFE